MKLTHNYHVYILKCRDDSYYVGVTNNLERRLYEHNEGFNDHCYTNDKRPVVLVYSELYSDIKRAILREKQLKGWSRKKKEALFNSDWEQIKQLSKSKNNPSTSSG
ncbi:GIY-YIG nuclease family protein [Pinibacter aurantiacus]|uniref:GIY-YIG nuclease family protein n=1 Tax=Pinibacter aurantiacus TaxID=2851599 RepID=A0A9E2SEW9_9BACT|nr:GIY-YIG nuclease family protein [Pinibacter aurantiacus]MBV4360322.1 GIY-YIG nuclease family protein [Pinibacter aurantiacus]